MENNNSSVSDILYVTVFLAGVCSFIWFGYVNYGWFGFLNWGWWGWFEKSESELFIERCELLLARIEEARFLGEAAFKDDKFSFEIDAALLVEKFTLEGCLDRYGTRNLLGQ